MSTTKLAFAALAGAGAVMAANQYAKPSRAHSLANGMRHQLDDYNSTVHPDSESWSTNMDRTKLMENAKKQKPWNMTYAERERLNSETK